VVKSALRVVVTVNTLPESKDHRAWQEFLGRITAVSATAELLHAMSVEGAKEDSL
jgi:hypothetical protein